MISLPRRGPLATTAPDPLAYARALWIHQMDQLGEKTLEEVAATAHQYAGADLVFIKAADQLNTMGPFIDRGKDAITGPLKVAELVARGKDVGLGVIPWVNPGNHDHAAFHATFAVQGRLVVDLEPYVQFWQDTPANVVLYLNALRAAGVLQLYVSIDPRHSATDALNLAAWAHLVDGLLPQLYWTDFQQPEPAVIPQLELAMDAFGVPVYPVYPYNGSGPDLQDAWSNAVNDGMTGCSLWRMGVADAAQLQAFSALALPTPPAPPDKPSFGTAERLQLCGYASGGSGVADLTAWLAGYRDA